MTHAVVILAMRISNAIGFRTNHRSISACVRAASPARIAHASILSATVVTFRRMLSANLATEA